MDAVYRALRAQQSTDKEENVSATANHLYNVVVLLALFIVNHYYAFVSTCEGLREGARKVLFLAKDMAWRTFSGYESRVRAS